MQRNLQARELGNLLTTKEIMFFQPKTLNDLIQIANTANYLDMPLMLDVTCAVIGLHMRKTAHDYRDSQGNPLQVSKQEDKHLRNLYKDTIEQSYNWK